MTRTCRRAATSMKGPNWQDVSGFSELGQHVGEQLLLAMARQQRHPRARLSIAYH